MLGHRDDRQRRIRKPQRLEIPGVVQIPLAADAYVQGDFASAALSRAAYDRLDDGLQWRQPGATPHAHHVPARVLRHSHLTTRRGEQHGVTRRAMVDQRPAHDAPRHRADVNVEQAVVPWRVRHRVTAPVPGPPGRLNLDVLSWQIAEGPVRPDRKDRDGLGPALMLNDLPGPPGRLTAGVVRGGRGHYSGEPLSGVPPRRRSLAGPGRAGDVLRHRDDSVEERPVVLLSNSELPVIPGELAKPLLGPLQIVEPLDEPGELA